MSQNRPYDITQYPDVLQAMLGLNATFEHSTLEPALLELVKVRASQLNGCGFCLDMHTKDARLEGETEQRLYLVSVWREASIYSQREKAALAWTEAVTRLENQHVPDAVYDQAKACFSDAELLRLTMAVVAINGWNRLGVAFNRSAGNYKAGSLKAMRAKAS